MYSRTVHIFFSIVAVQKGTLYVFCCVAANMSQSFVDGTIFLTGHISRTGVLGQCLGSVSVPPMTSSLGNMHVQISRLQRIITKQKEFITNYPLWQTDKQFEQASRDIIEACLIWSKPQRYPTIINRGICLVFMLL